ncbi:MAG: septation protein SpoVG family protein [Planctomycetes bacterium]|nr:septation protein SpoVG family protein [Planctomycetota bacterium]
MSDHLGVAGVRFTSASGRDVESGLIGWVSFTIGGLLLIDAVTLRRTREGRLTLSYPCRRDRNGVDHPLARPINDGCRRQLEAAVFKALGIATEGSRDAR